MREIKFRIWDKMTKKFITLENYRDLGAITAHIDGTMFFSSHYRFSGSMMIQCDTFIPCQYTGIKDRNGKEIYEGDILLWDNKTDEQDANIPPVKFVDGSFRCGDYCLFDLDLDAMYVIGNIYENPGLLKC